MPPASEIYHLHRIAQFVERLLGGSPFATVGADTEEFHRVSIPGVDTIATVTLPAAPAEYRWVVTGLSATLAARAVAPTAVGVQVLIYDGALAGAPLWGAELALPATAGAMSGIVESHLNLPATAEGQVSAGFSAAAGANTYEALNLHGYLVKV